MSIDSAASSLRHTSTVCHPRAECLVEGRIALAATHLSVHSWSRRLVQRQMSLPLSMRVFMLQGEEVAPQPPPPPPPQAPKPQERELNDYADAFGSVRRIDAHQTSNGVANGCALFSF